MNLRRSIVTALTLLSLSIISIIFFPMSKAQQKQSFVPTEIPVFITPMKVNGAMVPVEIQCEPVFIEKSDTLERFSCILVNKTDKSIRASSIRYSLLVDTGEQRARIDRLDTGDTYVHPDLSNVKRQTEPGGRLFIMAPGPIVQQDSVIKALELEPVYIEFSDGTTAGTNKEAEELIANLRKGAAQYKEILRQDYLRSGKSARGFLRHLENESLPELEGFSFAQRTGAKVYKEFFLQEYKKDRISAVRNLLDQ